MTIAHARYRRGSGIAVVCGPSAVFLPHGDRGLALRLWRSLRIELGVGRFCELLGELTAAGFAAIPDFALVDCLGDQVVVITRGRVEVSVQTGDQLQVVDGGGARSWTERQFELDAVDQVLVGVSEPPRAADARWFPLDVGAAGAAAVEMRLRGEVGVPENPVLAQDLVPQQTAPETFPTADEVPVEPSPPEAGNPYDALFGPTRVIRLEAAAVRPSADEPSRGDHKPVAREGDHDGRTAARPALRVGERSPTPEER